MGVLEAFLVQLFWPMEQSTGFTPSAIVFRTTGFFSMVVSSGAVPTSPGVCGVSRAMFGLVEEAFLAPLFWSLEAKHGLCFEGER